MERRTRSRGDKTVNKCMYVRPLLSTPILPARLAGTKGKSTLNKVILVPVQVVPQNGPNSVTLRGYRIK
jgi:hypothetical protein